jgi:RHS repeat-associated protein
VLVRGWLYQDRLKPVAEVDGGGNVVSRFIYGGKANVPEYMIRGGTMYRLITDHLGSVRLVMNTADGTVTQRVDYDEYGQLLGDSNPGFQPFGFSGGLEDEDAGLVQYGARAYSVDLGRWLTKDPIGENGGLNLYAYAGNNPINAIDPDGTTLLYSAAPFPGQNPNQLGPYTLNIDDGSDRVKPLQVLGKQDLWANEVAIYCSLKDRSIWRAFDPDDEGTFDTGYWTEYSADKKEYYLHQGKIYESNEINYFGIGMYEAWANDPKDLAQELTWAWKKSQYGVSPSDGTYYWLNKGYDDYNTMTHLNVQDVRKLGGPASPR